MSRCDPASSDIVDPDEIGRNYPVEIGAVADVKQALKSLLRMAKQLYPQARDNAKVKLEIAAYREEFAASNRELAASDAFPMMPQRILADLREVMPRNAIITTDVGWNKNGVGQQFPIYEPGSFITPGGYATMGFGSLAELDEVPREWFHFAHLCDAPPEIPSTKMGLIHTGRDERLYAGEGGIDIAAILNRMPEIPYSIELPNLVRVKELGHFEHAWRCLQTAKRYMATHPRSGRIGSELLQCDERSSK